MGRAESVDSPLDPRFRESIRRKPVGHQMQRFRGMAVRLGVVHGDRCASICNEHDDDDVLVKPPQDGFVDTVSGNLELGSRHWRESVKTPNGFGKDRSEQDADDQHDEVWHSGTIEP